MLIDRVVERGIHEKIPLVVKVFLNFEIFITNNCNQMIKSYNMYHPAETLIPESVNNIDTGGDRSHPQPELTC